MLRPEEEVRLTVSAADLNIVFAGLSELPYRVSAAAIERLRAQVIAEHPTAFDATVAPLGAPPPRVNGIDVAR